MSKEMDIALKTMNTTINLEKAFLEQILKMLEILLKDKEKLEISEVTKYEKMQKCIDVFKNHLLAGGILVPFKCHEEDVGLINQIIDENDKAYLAMVKDNDDKAFLGEFNGIHFAFDHLEIKQSDGTYLMFIKNTDLENINELKRYLDEKKYSNGIEMVEKDIRNVLKIDENKPLMSLEIINDKTFPIVANVLNAYRIPFEVANSEHSTSIIYEKEREAEVLHAIDTCKTIDIKERSLIIDRYNKNFNNRKEAQKLVDEMVNDAPKIEDILNNKNERV